MHCQIGECIVSYLLVPGCIVNSVYRELSVMGLVTLNSLYIKESVDSISRDGPDTPIYVIQIKKAL